jgi:DNA-binding MarR family transcriptional regulator
MHHVVWVLEMNFGESRPPEALSNFTGFLLNWVAAGSRKHFEGALDELGLKLQGFALMNTVDAEPGRTQQELVGLTHIDPSTMVQTLDDLAEAGFAERRPHPSDRRKYTIHLTKEGRRMLGRARRAAAEAGSESLGRLDNAERNQLRELLRKAAGCEG